MPPILMPALAPGVRPVFVFVLLLLLLWEECSGGGVDCVVETDVGDVREVEGTIVPEDADENGAVEVADDEGVEAAAARTDDGTEGNACIVLGSGLPPALIRSSSPQVIGPAPSLDIMLKVGVLIKSSPEKLSTCIWQMPFCS